MTQDELTKLINEFLPYPSKGQHYALRKFAMLVAESEREACAKMCDELETCSDAEFYGHEFSKAIRSRGNK